MTAVNYSSVEKNLKKYLDKVTNDFETIIVTRGDDEENIVLLSESEYNNMIENIYIRSNPEEYAKLLKSIEQLKSGQGMERELVEVDDE
jgi:antitoxin YefM